MAKSFSKPTKLDTPRSDLSTFPMGLNAIIDFINPFTVRKRRIPEEKMLNTNRRWFPGFLMIAIVMLACQTLIPGRSGGAEELFRDDFSDTSSEQWYPWTNDSVSVQYADGGLQFLIYPDIWFAWTNPVEQDFENYHVEVTVRNDSADKGSILGFTCHEFRNVEHPENSTFYYLGVSADGSYFIGIRDGRNEDVILADGTSGRIPSDNTPFKLAADCGNGSLVLYIDGSQIASAQDTTFTGGWVGLFAWSNELPNGTDVTFDDFVMTPLP